MFEKILGAKLERGDVDCDGDRRQARVLPGPGLATGFAQHPAAYRQDQATVFGDGQKLRWLRAARVADAASG